MSRPAIHPGQILADELEDSGVTPTELSRQIDVPPNRITDHPGQTRDHRGHRLAPGQLVQDQCAVLAQSAGRYDLRIATEAIGGAVAKLPTRPTIGKTERTKQPGVV